MLYHRPTSHGVPYQHKNAHSTTDLHLVLTKGWSHHESTHSTTELHLMVPHSSIRAHNLPQSYILFWQKGEHIAQWRPIAPWEYTELHLTVPHSSIRVLALPWNYISFRQKAENIAQWWPIAAWACALYHEATSHSFDSDWCKLTLWTEMNWHYADLFAHQAFETHPSLCCSIDSYVSVNIFFFFSPQEKRDCELL